MKLINVWAVPDDYLATLEPGTEVCAGDKSTTGLWCGIKKNGIKVVAWTENIFKSDDPSEYVNTLMDYAKQ